MENQCHALMNVCNKGAYGAGFLYIAGQKIIAQR